MNIDCITGGKPVSYVPIFGGERKKSADQNYEPVIFYLLPMTVEQYENSGELLRRVDEDSGEATWRVKPENVDDIFIRHVAKIENLRVAGGETIGDGKAFADCRKTASSAFAPLFMEILAAVRDVSVLSEGMRKN